MKTLFMNLPLEIKLMNCYKYVMIYSCNMVLIISSHIFWFSSTLLTPKFGLKTHSSVTLGSGISKELTAFVSSVF